MELRSWALQILEASTLELKLKSPSKLSDEKPGDPLFIDTPSRPPGMGFCKRTKKDKLPKIHELASEEKRAICLHRFAGHELLAVEMMAFALLAFPLAPATFRKGLAQTLKDEQLHVKLYCDQLERFGCKFGDMPLYKHFWVHTRFLHSPINYVSTVSLTMEMANLDFAPRYGKAFESFQDKKSSALMARILIDEIRHVNFGWRWLKKFKDSDISEWDAWKLTQSDLMSPKRSRGFILHEKYREKAGISQEWIENLKLLR